MSLLIAGLFLAMPAASFAAWLKADFISQQTLSSADHKRQKKLKIKFAKNDFLAYRYSSPIR